MNFPQQLTESELVFRLKEWVLSGCGAEGMRRGKDEKEVHITEIQPEQIRDGYYTVWIYPADVERGFRWAECFARYILQDGQWERHA